MNIINLIKTIKFALHGYSVSWPKNSRTNNRKLNFIIKYEETMKNDPKLKT